MPGARRSADSEEDEEEDEDYVPPADKDSCSEASDQEDTEVTVPDKVTDEGQKRSREALWDSFQASISDSSKTLNHHAPQKMVKIERKYLFAGNEVVEVVEVPEDSPEAKKWPHVKESNAETPSEPSPSIPPTEQPPQSTSATFPVPLDALSTTKEASIINKPPAKRPGPRKPKTALPSLPGPATTKKLSTLDKSAMDWRAHIQMEAEAGSSVKDELEANRKGGGYLEKVEFLKRVEDRKEETLDAIKSNKRRRL